MKSDGTEKSETLVKTNEKKPKLVQTTLLPGRQNQLRPSQSGLSQPGASQPRQNQPGPRQPRQPRQRQNQSRHSESDSDETQMIQDVRTIFDV